MNKTININLGGIFFHIDETAFQKLKRYLDAIRRSLSDDPQGRDEIITDIESRISELLSDRVKDARQVISEADIDEVIDVMGQPEDYMVDEELFTDDSGENYQRRPKSKKLFRDGEDRFLGGVSSGIAHYFDVDVIWIRIAWLVATFGLGFGPLLYIILWILLPEAKTTAEKLQMEGEPVNISNIEKRVRAEFESASESIKGAASEVTGAVKEGYENVSNSLKKKNLKNQSSSARSGLQDFIDTIGKIIVGFFMVIGKFIGVILIIVSVAALIALIISLFTAGTVDFMGVDWMFDDGDFQVINPTGVPLWIISLLVLILVGIPFLMLFFLGLFILSSKTKILSRTAKFVLLGIWIIALLGAIYVGLKQASEFAYEGSSTEVNEIVLIPSDTLAIKMIDDEAMSNYSELRNRHNYKKVYDANDVEHYYSNNVRFNIRKSDSTEAYVKVRKEARGRNRLVARENAESIDYSFEKINNNLLLNGFYLTDTDVILRDKDLLITLYIPENQHIFLDASTRSFLKYNIKTTRDIYHRDMAEHVFKMTDAGLECLNCSDDIWRIENEDEDDGFKLNIDEDGVEIKINDDGEEAELKIDEEGIRIK